MKEEIKAEAQANGETMAEARTLREHFAALAMQGLLAGKASCSYSNSLTADRAVKIADDLLLRLAEPELEPDEPDTPEPAE